MNQITGSITEINRMDDGDWFVEIKQKIDGIYYLRRHFHHLWAAFEIGRRLYYLVQYGTDYAPEYTGYITIQVVEETGQIIDFTL